MLYRQPAVAGTFYPFHPDHLKESVWSCFTKQRGPGLPERASGKRIIGAVVPHAGYTFSGCTAAHTYKAIAEAKNIDVIIILGPSHTNPGVIASVWQSSDWLTPFGRVVIDKKIGSRIVGGLFDKNTDPHLDEHSIEVQLPFLQYIFKNNMPRILPIVVSAPLEIEVCRKLGEKIAKAIEGENALIIASSDFTHYGINYDYVPFFGPDKIISRKIREIDNEAINYIRKLDGQEFVKFVKQTNASICGASPIAILLFALKKLGAKRGRLLDYVTSGDLSGDWKNSVSYASLVFE